MPDLGSEPQAIYLHPGEPVFEAVMDLFLGQHEHLGMRGAIFEDPESSEPYLFTLARATVLRDSARAGEKPEVTDEEMVGVKRFADGRMELAPAHLLLTLFEPQTTPVPVTPLVNAASETTQTEAFMIQQVALPVLEKRRRDEETRLPDQMERLRVAYNLRQAELLRQRRLLKEAVANGVPAANSKLHACDAELERLDSQRRQAEAELYAEPERLRLGPVSLYAHALVLPVPATDVERRRDANAEKVALEEVIRRETDEESIIEDVSAPHLKAGFDLKITRADGSLRYVEVKGRSGETAVELTENEWRQAANHPDRYWLYVVYNCESLPILHRVSNPFSNLFAEHTGAVRILASAIKKTAI
jgi:hypothetical protein